jgi:O-antigen ligase
LIPFVLLLICLAWWGLRRSVLRLGALVLAGASVLAFTADLHLSEILAPRVAALLERSAGSLDVLKSAMMRDGMWEWGLSKVGVAPSKEWLFGFGFEHMLELTGFADPRESNKTYGYVHNVFLGTRLTFGTVGLTCLLAAMLGAVLRIGRFIERPSGQVLALLLVSGLVLGFWSGNTVFSIPLLAVGLAVSLKVQGEEGRFMRKSRS